MTTSQQIVRYAYYGIELTYLLNIKLEDILLGIFYVAGLSLFMLLPYELLRAPKKTGVIIKQIIFGFICCVFTYALTLRPAWDYYLLFLILILFLDCIVNLIYKKCGEKITSWIEQTSTLSKITLMFIILIALIIGLQFTVESYNKRFTYIEDNDRCYAVLTTYQDCYITVESEIVDNEITILRGNVKLIPISGSVLEGKQFNSKILK